MVLIPLLSEAYGNLAQKISEDYKALYDFIKGKNPKILQNPYPRTIIHNNGGRLFETNDGELVINPRTLLAGI